MKCLTSNRCVAGIRKVTSHSSKNSIILASSLGRIFWTAWSAVSMSGTCFAEVLLLFAWHIHKQSRVGTIWNPLAWFLHIFRDLSQAMGRVAWIGNAVTRKSVLEILLGALLLVVGNLRLTLRCLCLFVCGCGPPYALLVWWTHVG